MKWCITSELLEKYKNYLYEEEKSPATIQKYMHYFIDLIRVLP